jgi:hypothetical protein
MRALSGAAPYIAQLSDNYDVMIASEHRLYECELNKLQEIFSAYDVHSKASSNLDNVNCRAKPGHGGIVIGWKAHLGSRVRQINVDSDRIVAIELIGVGKNASNVFIIGVYLPHQMCVIADFDHHVDILEDIIDQCLGQGEVIIMGDLNCHFGSSLGPRFSGSSTTNAKQFIKMVDRLALNIVDGDANVCAGPCYTFHVDNVGESYIDHVVVSNTIVANIANCRVLEDCIENSSDHLPITLCVNVDHLPNPLIRHSKSKVAWHKVCQDSIHERYTQPLQQKLSLHFPQYHELAYNLSESEVEAAIKVLVDDMISVGENLPHSKYNKALKPFWSKSLTKANKEQKNCWNYWRQKGKPRDKNNEMYIQYKDAKRRFRCEQTRAERDYEQGQMALIIKTSNVDQKFFWHLVGKHRKKKKRLVIP